MRTILQKLQTEIVFSRSIISLAFEKDAAGINKHSSAMISFFVNSAFLKFWVSWEGFLEESFHYYMMGMPSINGIVLTKHVSPTTMEHAQNMVIGTNKYFDWANSELVLKIGEYFFGQVNPFKSTLNSITSDLQNMKNIRNSAAHISTTTQIKLDGVATRILRRPTSNILASDLLMKTIPLSPVQTTLFEYYINLIGAASEAIAKA